LLAHPVGAFKSRCAGLLPFRIIASSRSRSSTLNRTTYRFTQGTRADIIASIARIAIDKESLNPFGIVEARH
jgi:hypothetical protein